MKIEQAKKNIINNFRANYTNDRMENGDVENFLLNALDQFEQIIFANDEKIINDLKFRVRQAENSDELNRAIVALYKLVGYSEINKDIINYGNNLLSNYENNKISQYIQKLEKDLTELMKENKELRKLTDL